MLFWLETHPLFIHYAVAIVLALVPAGVAVLKANHADRSAVIVETLVKAVEAFDSTALKSGISREATRAGVEDALNVIVKRITEGPSQE